MRILFLSRWYPYPADNGSKLRVSGLLQALCERHEVTLISFFDPRETPAEPAPSVPGPIDIQRSPYREFDRTSGRALAGLVSRTPRFLVDTFDRRMDAMIREAVARTPFDLVIASQLPMAAYYRSFAGVPAIFDEVELGAYEEDGRDGSRLGRMRRRLTRAKHHRFMARLLSNFAGATVVSEIERSLVAEAAPAYASVHVVPNGVSVGDREDATRTPERASGSLIFTGSLRYGPNHEAVSWFVREILPELRSRAGNVRLTVTGDSLSNAPSLGESVVYTGRVQDVRSLVAASEVSIAPIRSGGGTRLKILEAMAVRTPVVATSKAVEGLAVRHGEHVLVADTPSEFAAAVHTLLKDRRGASQMADRAWERCRGLYDARVVGAQFLGIVEAAARNTKALHAGALARQGSAA